MPINNEKVKSFVGLTDLVKKLVALIKHKDLEVVQGQVASFGESKDAAGRSHDDVRRVDSLEELNVSVHRVSTINNLGADVLHVLGEADHLGADLVGQLASVAQNQGAADFGVVRDGVKDRQQEDCGLSHTGDGLAEHVLAEDSDGDTFLLDIGGVLKAAVGGGLEELWLEEHVLEAGGVDTGVVGGLGGAVVRRVEVVVELVGFEHEFLEVGQFSVLGLLRVNHGSTSK